jgi:hypothetical protein
MNLAETAWGALNKALEVYQDNPRATHWLHRHLARFSEPLRLAIVGAEGTGKSTLLNAIVGEQVELGARAIAEYRASTTVSATVYPPSGPPRELPMARVDRRLHLDSGGVEVSPADRIVVNWPSRSLRDLILIDTPAGQVPDADAVLYLLPRPQNADLQPLRTLYDNPVAGATPVNALVVLSRADEIGSGRVDALISARQIARRHRREPELRELCQDVIPVAGLVASAGRTLEEPEFDALAALAAIPKAELDPHLLSVDRFAHKESPLPGSPELRQLLLHRFGLFGVRLAVMLIRQGSDTVPTLAAQLVQRSGFGELRDAIGQCFTDRTPVFKARSALIALEVLLRMEPHPGTVGLAATIDRALSGAHDFRELRLLASLRTGKVALPEDLAAEALRLVGGEGTDPAARLGVEEEPSTSDVQYLLADIFPRWRGQAENPALGVEERRAAKVVVRSCEALAQV